MDLALTKQWITRWESSRAQAYDDANGRPLNPGDVPIGKPTVGVGLNLATPAAVTAITNLGLDFQSVLSGATLLTAEQIDTLLGGSIDLALITARRLVPNFDDLPDNQQLVVTDLSFNMGGPTLAKFVNTLKFIQAQDWPNAAANLSQSAWFKQVGSKPGQRAFSDVAVLGNTDTPQNILGI